MDDAEDHNNAVAIIGLSGRFPDAPTLDLFWNNISKGIDSISRFPDLESSSDSVGAAKYVNAKGILNNIALFDADFFGFSPNEAEVTDPQHRIFLELVWEALENAGYSPEKYPGPIGVYGSAGFSSYLINNILPNSEIKDKFGEYFLHLANDRDFITTKASYKLNLKGPSLNIQTACSSSLVAVCTACNHLLTYQCDIALAGGVSISLPEKSGYLYQKGMIFSPDGYCRPFDAKANGTVPGNGGGIVVLKRLAEALEANDHIYAVVKGYAINNDGADKVGFSAPSLSGQVQVIDSALAMADIHPETISYLEAHGTGTLMGDPLEIDALNKAYGIYTDKKNYCAIGSLKGNIGHLIEASGIAGFIKTILSLHHRYIPPSLHVETPNPNIDFENSPFFVNTTLNKWEKTDNPRRAGISSFGMGGTNAHVILEESPQTYSAPTSRKQHLLTLSAKKPSALKKMVSNLENHLNNYDSIILEDIAYTLRFGRNDFDYRYAFVCNNVEDAISELTAYGSFTPKSCSEMKKEGDPSIVFMFTGQGSQYVNMGYDLYQSEPVFRETIDQCFAILKAHTQIDFFEILYPSPENFEIAQSKLNETAYAQPSLFIIEYALAKLWRTWGIIPDVMIGHSLGEYVAACLSGVFSLEEALILVAARGQLMQKMDPGKMLAVSLSEEEIKPFLEEHVSIAVINHTKSIVLSGPSNNIESISKNLEEKGIDSRMLRTSHAFHSESVEKIIPEFREKLSQVNFNPPSIPFISNASGKWVESNEVTSVDYWIRHLRHTVQFSRGILELLSNPNAIFIEVGPGKTLCNLVRRHVTSDDSQIISGSLPTAKKNEEDREVLLKTLGQLWLYDIPIDWEKIYQKSNRVPLPTYPFDKKKYWIDSSAHPQETKDEVNREKSTKDIDFLPDQKIKKDTPTEVPKTLKDIEEFLIVTWKDLLGHKSIDKNDDFFQLGGDSLLSVQLLTKIEDTFGFNLNVQTLFERTTISKLSKGILKKISSEDRTSEKAFSQTLIKLKPGKNGKNLFFVHPIDGHVFCYKQLVDALESDYTVYGIQSPNYAQESARSFESFEEQAAYYIQAIQAIQKKPPYFLAGFSFGGLVAYEMANQLWTNDDSIGLLVMMDVIPPNSQSEDAKNEDQMIKLLLELFEGKLVAPDELRGLSKEDRIKRLMRSIGFGEWPFSQQERIFNQVVDHWKSLSKYKLKSYPGKILLFQAEDRFIHSKNCSLEKVWEGYVSQGVEAFDVEGSHLGVLKQPFVHAVARRLSRALSSKDNKNA